MNVWVIDDDDSVLQCLVALLARQGHTVKGFLEPRAALDSLRPDVDLILCDVNMPGLDGFEVARRVADALGTCPPKTLLVSGISDGAGLDAYPPGTVIGLLRKPVLASTLRRVVGFLGSARSRCPGVLAPLCALVEDSVRAGAARPACELCESPRYAMCAEYDAGCGRAMRRCLASDGELLRA